MLGITTRAIRTAASSAATQTAAAAIVVEGRLRQKDETTHSESETSETEGRRGVGPASVRVIRSARRACRADSRTTLKILEQERVFSTSTCTVRHSWRRGQMIAADQMMMTMMLKVKDFVRGNLSLPAVVFVWAVSCKLTPASWAECSLCKDNNNIVLL